MFYFSLFSSAAHTLHIHHFLFGGISVKRLRHSSILHHPIIPRACARAPFSQILFTTIINYRHDTVFRAHSGRHLSLCHLTLIGSESLLLVFLFIVIYWRVNCDCFDGSITNSKRHRVLLRSGVMEKRDKRKSPSKLSNAHIHAIPLDSKAFRTSEPLHKTSIHNANNANICTNWGWCKHTKRKQNNGIQQQKDRRQRASKKKQ